MVKIQRLFAKTNLKIQVCRIKKIGVYRNYLPCYMVVFYDDKFGVN